MSARQQLALAVIAMQNGNEADCLSYMAKATEYSDDLSDFVDEYSQLPPRAARNDPATPAADNTIAPSLAATASNFLRTANRLARITALSAAVDDGDELEEFPSDEFFDDEEFELDKGDDGLDEDDEDEEEEDIEAVACVGPVRYKR